MSRRRSTAVGGQVPGRSSSRHAGPAQLIAEDLGEVTPEVTALRDRFRLPGIKVLQFAFGTDPQAPTFLPHSYERNSAAYTGTHDNDTTVGWFHDPGSPAAPSGAMRARAPRGARVISGSRTPAARFHWDMIRGVWSSVANLALAPMQDFLGLGSSARMNLPGTSEANWEWRLSELPPAEVRERLRLATRIYGRAAQ